MTRSVVQTGLEKVLSGDTEVRLAGRRVALIGNPTSVDTMFRHAADGLLTIDCELAALFGPEHGIRGDAQYMVSVNTSSPSSGVPVYSLYGATEESLAPSEDSLSSVDVVVFDIQDVGARYYTYVWTMVLAMRMCARLGIDFVVLDRPNPIGGTEVEGGWISPGFKSFVGLRSIPNRHGLTVGEIAQWTCADEKLDLHLDIVRMDGWRRQMLWTECGVPWVQPSPNMPTPDTALVYPGMCLLEGTEISEGRGCTRPFEFAGAPYIDSNELVSLLETQMLPGVAFRKCGFIPTFDKYSGLPCRGVQLHVSNPTTYLPYRTGIAFVWAVHKLWPDAFAWRSHAYEFVSDIPAIDLLTGSSVVREGIDAGADLQELSETWRAGQDEFLELRKDWLLYE